MKLGTAETVEISFRSVLTPWVDSFNRHVTFCVDSFSKLATADADLFGPFKSWLSMLIAKRIEFNPLNEVGIGEERFTVLSRITIRSARLEASLC